MSLNKNITSPIAKRLRYAREAKGISQKKLGILASIDEFSASPRINQYERGKHVPDFSTSQRLAKALDISVTFFYADDEELAELIWLFFKANTEHKGQIKTILKK